MSNIFAKKPLDLLFEEMNGKQRLKRVLGPVSLTSLGVGCVIGAGIFVTTGIVAHDKTGPALILSFIVAGMACIFAALSYAEFAAMVPVAGSAYTYAYATLGETFAWIIGWDLFIEYTVAAASIAESWSGYFRDFLTSFTIGGAHLHIPEAISKAPFDLHIETGKLVATGTYIDLPAALIAAILTVILVVGIKESAKFNNTMVGLKLLVVGFVIAVGAFYIHPENWRNFAPYGYGGISFFDNLWVLGKIGKDGSPLGMLAGAATIFYAYIGFDSVSTHAEEAKNPQRDVPIGIIASLIICTVLYVAVSAVLTGMVPYNMIDIHAPISNAFQHVGLGWAHFLVSLGALAGLTSVLLVLMLSQPRICLAMARDGLLPSGFFGAVHKKFRTPYKSTILTGTLVGLMAAIIPLRILVELVNIGTLLAFVMVCMAVTIMRYTNPDANRPFRCPFVPFVPIAGVLLCLMLMFSLPPINWERLGIWMVIGLVIYFSYGKNHSVMAKYRKKEKEKVM